MSQCQEGDRALEKADELHAQQSRATCLLSGVGLLLAIVLCRLQVERTVDWLAMVCGLMDFVAKLASELVSYWIVNSIDSIAAWSMFTYPCISDGLRSS